MKASEIIKKIECKYPIESAYEFDNTGANIIDYNDNIVGILICLDINIKAIEFAKKNGLNLIISHHPLTFNEYKNINSDIQSKKIKNLIKNRINAYSIHTNFDVNINNGMGKLVLDKIFKKSEIKEKSFIEEIMINKKKYGLGYIVTLNNKISINRLYEKVLSSLDINYEKASLYVGKEIINRIAILPGSGSGDINTVINNEVDCFITSDLKHNQIVDLLDSEISYINTTHYGAEKVYIEFMQKYIKSITKTKVMTYFDDRF